MTADDGTAAGPSGRPGMPRLIAWYLPQYHPIAENDAWWGRGFTDWVNVAKARPRFADHHQPRLPGELGFYDLRVPEVREAQAALARAHGLHGFCYYHYWFNGRRLLERPFTEVLTGGAPDFPFCLCWANENWTRAWDGLDRDVLIAQRYDEDDDRRHLHALAPAFRDPRYIRVDGRPLFLVYRVSAIPDPRRTAEVWRAEARALGIGDLYLCTVESLRFDRVDPATIGFDAAVDFQPDWLALGDPDRVIAGDTRVYDYATVVARMLARPEPGYRRFGGVTPGWDNTARRREAGVVLHGATPDLYAGWLRRVVERAARQGGDAPVFVNAWNEWAEAAYLEPCARWGRAFLEATRDALAPRPPQPAPRPPQPAPPRGPTGVPLVSVCIPAYNGARFLGEAIESVLRQSTRDLELVVVDDQSSDATLAVVRSFRDPRLVSVENPARLGLVGNWNRCLGLARAPYVCVFHQDDVMLPTNLERKLALLEAHPSVGMVYSSVHQIGPTGKLLSPWWYREPQPDDEGVRAGREEFAALFDGVNRVCCPTVVWRRALYERLGGFEARLPFTADWEMWMRLALFADVGYLGEPLVQYRRHDGNETGKYLGAKEIEHAFRAKRIVLEKHGDRIPRAALLHELLVERYRARALAEAVAAYRARRAADARAYLDFALGLPDSDEQASGAGREWLADAVHGICAAVVDTRAADVPADVLRTTEGFDAHLRAAYPRDLARHVTLRRMLKAMLVKLANRPGLGWLHALRPGGPPSDA